MIKLSILLKIQNMMDIKEVLHQWFTNFLTKKTSGRGIKNENIFNKEFATIINQLLENLTKEKHTHLLLTIFGVQM